MYPQARWHLLLSILLFLPLALSTAPTSFCKCTCYNNNSTIIPLDSPPSGPTQDSTGNPPQPHRSCADCNKQFCLSYHLPICQDATESDVFATCFQRDSKKDQAVVLVFLGATGGLLAWAAVGPWVSKWRGWRGYGAVGRGGEDDE